MTDGDDGLAPVTPLFGARRAGDTDPDERVSSPASHPSFGGGSRARSGTRSSGGSGTRNSRDGDGSSDGWAEPGTAADDESSAPAPLPTYEAFAAKTEGSSASRRSDTPRLLVAVDSASEPQRRTRVGERDEPDEPDRVAEVAEPEETLEAARSRAENISLHALSRRGVPSAEMAKTLRSRDLPDEVVDDEIARLERVGLLDDAELAETLVRTKQDRKGLGKQAISSELRQRGIAQEAIEAAIDEIDDDEEQVRADEWAVKRAGQLRGLDQATAERRLNGYLMRRGYRSDVIRRAVERALPRGGSSRGGVHFE